MATGTGTLTPIASGVPGSGSIAEALPRTHLSLFRYAQILGIAPLHFAGAVASSLDPQVFPVNGCDSIWPRYSWQDSDQVSHEDLARAIQDAEHDIAAVLGYPVAPTWIAEEVHAWPRYHRREMYGLRRNVQGANLGIKTKWGKVSAGGRRKVASVGTATTAGGSLVYQDLDGDGFAERARIQLSTSLTDVNEIKAYFTGKSGAQAWEIRPVLSKSISGGTLTMTFPSWLFIDPNLQAAYPTSDGPAAIDCSTTANFVTAVDVYRETTDNTVASAQLVWEPEASNPQALGVFCTTCGGSGCAQCTLTTQDGCLTVRDAELGIVAPVAATYDADDARWEMTTWTRCHEPVSVKLWYRAGAFGNEYLTGESYDPLSGDLAHAIAWMATARLERAFCQCGNATALADHWREDLAKNTQSASQILAMTLLDNPFGTRRGELMAWQRISKMTSAVTMGGAV